MGAHFYTLTRSSGQEVSVRYHVTSWGAPATPPTYASGGDPPDPMEIEIDDATDAETGDAVTLSEGETEAVYRAILDDPPEPDIPEDWR